MHLLPFLQLLLFIYSTEAQNDYPNQVQVVQALRDSGYAVTEGTIKFFNISSCEPVGKTCYGNNPLGGYAYPVFPNRSGDLGGFKLDIDEAVVFVGVTPPTARYFGFTNYIMESHSEDDKPVQIFGSVDDTINQANIKTTCDRPWSCSTAFISTANIKTQQSVAQVLSKFIALTAINTMTFDASILKLGLSNQSDTLSVIQRYTFETKEQSNTWQLTNFGYALIVKTPNVGTDDMYGYPNWKVPAASPNEDWLLDSFNLLVSVIKAKFPNAYEYESSDIYGLRGVVNGYSCLNKSINCFGNNNDALYLGTTYPILFPIHIAKKQVICVGVIHTLTKKATYTNLVLMNDIKLLGLGGASDIQMQGSAASWIPTDPNNGYLYAYYFSRDCTTLGKYCFQIPETFPGLAGYQLASFIERIYVEPSTNVAPDQKTVIYPRCFSISD